MVTLFHDFTDPASAVVVHRAVRLRREGVPILLEGFDAVGIDAALPPTLSLLATLEQISGVASAEGTVLRRPAQVPPTARAHTVVAHAAETGDDDVVNALVLSLYRRFWTQGEDLNDLTVLTQACAESGCPSSTVVADDPVAIASQRRAMAVFRREGVGGVPIVLASRTLIPGLLDEDQLRMIAATT